MFFMTPQYFIETNLLKINKHFSHICKHYSMGDHYCRYPLLVRLLGRASSSLTEQEQYPYRSTFYKKNTILAHNGTTLLYSSHTTLARKGTTLFYLARKQLVRVLLSSILTGRLRARADSNHYSLVRP